jgi:hypothetical protein
MMNSPGLTLFPLSAALEKLKRLGRRSAEMQIVNHHFVFFIATFRDS